MKILSNEELKELIVVARPSFFIGFSSYEEFIAARSKNCFDRDGKICCGSCLWMRFYSKLEKPDCNSGWSAPHFPEFQNQLIRSQIEALKKEEDSE